jgi:hypothetical protein
MRGMPRVSACAILTLLLISVFVFINAGCSRDSSPVSVSNNVRGGTSGPDLSKVAPVSVYIKDCEPVDDQGNYFAVVETKVGGVVTWHNTGEYEVKLYFPTELFGIDSIVLAAEKSADLTVAPGTSGSTYDYAINCGDGVAGISKTSAGTPKVVVGEEP